MSKAYGVLYEYGVDYVVSDTLVLYTPQHTSSYPVMMMARGSDVGKRGVVARPPHNFNYRIRIQQPLRCLHNNTGTSIYANLENLISILPYE